MDPLLAYLFKLEDDDAIEGLRRILLNISKTVQLIFTKLISFLGNHL